MTIVDARKQPPMNRRLAARIGKKKIPWIGLVMSGLVRGLTVKELSSPEGLGHALDKYGAVLVWRFIKRSSVKSQRRIFTQDGRDPLKSYELSEDLNAQHPSYAITILREEKISAAKINPILKKIEIKDLKIAAREKKKPPGLHA